MNPSLSTIYINNSSHQRSLDSLKKSLVLVRSFDDSSFVRLNELLKK